MVVEGLSEKEILMDVENSVVIAEGGGEVEKGIGDKW